MRSRRAHRVRRTLVTDEAGLVGIDDAGARALATQVQLGQKRGLPGMVRASIGLTSTSDDVDRLVTAVGAIARGEHDDAYVEDHRGDWS